MDTNTPKTTVQEAGRKGGKVTAERHGPSYFAEIGKLGGAAKHAKRREAEARLDREE
jgi:general stress protein YciG